MKRLYLTTAIPYVNAEPHIGFAYELVLADVIARGHRLRGREVRSLAGTDENSLKNVQAAMAAGKTTKDYVDEMAVRFQGLRELMDLSYDDFIRTTESRHVAAVNEFWRRCATAVTPDGQPVIYKKSYRGLYCVGCETFYAPDELSDGKCPEHQKTPEIVDEENYFFRLSAYTHQLATLIGSDRFQIVPEGRKREMTSFIEGGLEDFSISRSKTRAKGWGIPVPGDPDQVMYVWFDALTNYRNALQADALDYWWESGESDVWHVIGKGITRFHAIYWPAMLIAAGMRVPRGVMVHGYLTIEGQKMSKSLGNVLSPYTVVEKYGSELVRYYLARSFSPFEDGDFADASLRARYAADLQHGIGNLVARVTTLAEKSGTVHADKNSEMAPIAASVWQSYETSFDEWRIHDALTAPWRLVSECDQTVERTKLWELAQSDPKKAAQILGNLCEGLRHIAHMLRPYMPKTSEAIFERLGLDVDRELGRPFSELVQWNETVFNPHKGSPLFPPLT